MPRVLIPVLIELMLCNYNGGTEHVKRALEGRYSSVSVRVLFGAERTV